MWITMEGELIEIKKQDGVKAPTISREDILKWDESKCHEVMLFCTFFYDEDTGKITPTRECLIAAEQYSDSSEVFKDMLAIINYPSSTEPFKKNKVYLKLLPIFRSFQLTIKKFPEKLLPTTVTTFWFKKQFEWLHDVYKEDGTVKPTPVVVTPIQEENNNKNSKVVVLTSETYNASLRLQEATQKLIELYNGIVDSISIKEIQKLSAKDKILALNKLSFINTSVKKTKHTAKILNIDPTKATKEDLESNLLDFGEDE